MRQNRLSLVIRCVRDGYPVQAARTCDGSKELVTQAPRAIFEIPTVAARLASHIGPVRYEIKPKFARKPGNELFVFVRVRTPKLVVEMQNEKPDSERRTQVV
jgi:hypothetical protein